MQVPFDTELVTCGVYIVAAPLYALLWRRHIRHAYAALAVAALILSLCAFLRSEMVKTWELTAPQTQQSISVDKIAPKWKASTFPSDLFRP
jgi:hypothetical protein